MIVFDLECRGGGHRFEGWFKSSDDFARQCERGLVACPRCGSADVAKAPMAARLARKGNQALAPVAKADPPARQPTMASPKLPPEAAAMMRALAAMQAEAIKDSQWVGDNFAEESRAMHYGERDPATIHGQATREEAEELWDEGIVIAPLLIPVAPPDEVN
ncbi:MAG: DUF1178 family protein [Novosphingobium sp.]|nr:DUF1178 family protein [Novosphingobium sp.]